jgi:hypothetical protein
MKNNKKTISVIIKIKKKNKKNTDRPDAGHWIFDELNNQWVENTKLIEEMKSFYTLRRENEDSKFIFHVDSFPRQGNTTLRSILLQCFPELAMPDPMAHVTASTYEAIKNGQIVISSIRDPHDALCSFVSRVVLEGQFKENYINKNKIEKKIINQSIKFYNRYLNFLIKNHKSIYLIQFDEILKIHKDYISFKESHNKILKFFSKKYNLKFTEDDRLRFNSVNYSSTVDKNIKSHLMTNRYYLKKVKKSYKLYVQILQIIDEDEKLFST